jgi:hypothetical protein
MVSCNPSRFVQVAGMKKEQMRLISAVYNCQLKLISVRVNMLLIRKTKISGISIGVLVFVCYLNDYSVLYKSVAEPGIRSRFKRPREHIEIKFQKISMSQRYEARCAPFAVFASLPTEAALGRLLLITNSLHTGLEITSAEKISKGEANQITH